MRGFAVPADLSPYRGGLFEGRSVLVAPARGAHAGAVVGLLAGLGARVMAGAAPGSGASPGPDGAGAVPAYGIAVEAADPGLPEQADVLVARAWERFGVLDTVVCVGLGDARPGQAAVSIALADWKAAVDGELNAVWFLMHAAARRWRDRGQPGSIVCLVNPYREAVAGAAPQRAAGAAVAHLAKTVAVEWAPFGIRVNCVAPAAAAAPRRVADAVAWLSAPSGKFVTGEVVSVAALAAGGQR